MASLNPVFTVGEQIAETAAPASRSARPHACGDRVVELLRQVRISVPSSVWQPIRTR